VLGLTVLYGSLSNRHAEDSLRGLTKKSWQFSTATQEIGKQVRLAKATFAGPRFREATAHGLTDQVFSIVQL
jgi:hypothetical protein